MINYALKVFRREWRRDPVGFVAEFAVAMMLVTWPGWIGLVFEWVAG